MALHERYPLSYRVLKQAGHDPTKAIEILLNASRGDRHSILWIKTLRRLVRTK